MTIEIDKDRIVTILKNQYDMESTHLEKMDGYESINYKVSSGSDAWVLKIYGSAEHSLITAKAENEIMKALTSVDGSFPSPIQNSQGEEFTFDEKTDTWFRMLTYLPGTFLAHAEHKDLLVESFGSFLAVMDKKLSQLDNVTIRSKRIVWDLDYFLENEKLLIHINDARDRKIVFYFINQWRTTIQSRAVLLRKALIHNDANDWNVLTQNGKISGLIDFGDMVYSRLIYEIAVAAAYLLVDKEDPVTVLEKLVSAYHHIYPLQEAEIDLLYYLIAGRLCTSVLNSALEKKEQPDKEYIVINEKGFWKLLYKWIEISPIGVQRRLRKKLGMNVPDTSSSDLLNMRHKLIPSVYSLSYSRPIHMAKACFQYMYDAEGNAILDAYNNIIHVGHCHPDVVEAGQKAMANLNTNMRYLYRPLTDYADHLLSYFPPELNKVFLVNSGSAAGDLAIRLARLATDRTKIAVHEHGYHGNTQQGILLSHYKYGNKGGSGKSSEIIQGLMPDTYRGKFQGPEAGKQYAQLLIDELKDSKDDIAAFISEPIMGCGGQVPLAIGYLKEVYTYLKSIGAVCISDEVQTGFGRLGKWFWGYEMYDVVPDIVILGKPIGNGHPMAAVVTTQRIADLFDNGMEFFSSFGGNPVSCAIGNEVLNVIERESLQSNATIIGAYLKKKLLALSEIYPQIGDVRGEGLFLGVDIVADKNTRQPDGQKAKQIVNYLREQNILSSLDGPGNNVIKIKPPLCFNQKNAELLVLKVTNALAAHS